MRNIGGLLRIRLDLAIGRRQKVEMERCDALRRVLAGPAIIGTWWRVARLSDTVAQPMLRASAIQPGGLGGSLDWAKALFPLLP